jgi:DNA-binding response OmpR family regulator
VAALAGAGHRVHEAASAEAAERLVRVRRPGLDALVCDVVLPDGTGPALVERLRGLGEASPVLYMSGYSSEDLDRSAGPGLVAVLPKPFAPAVLLARLAELVERQAAG